MALSGQMPTHPVFKWLWKSKCQPKHMVFFWLVLQDKLNTRDRLRRRHMELESYTCKNCILQRSETVYHLFLRCSFATRCWATIGVVPPRVLCPQRAIKHLTKHLINTCSMGIIILSAWSIWKCRNGWIFENEPPTLERYRSLLAQELRLLQYRVKPDIAEKIVQWMHSVHL
jgi:hypothetical protein